MASWLISRNLFRAKGTCGIMVEEDISRLINKVMGKYYVQMKELKF